MVLNRKAIIFSLLAIGLSGLFIILFASTYESRIDEQSRNAHARINMIDDSITEFYNYVDEAQKIAGREALLSLYNYLKDSTVPGPIAYIGADQFETTFIACMRDGSDTGIVLCRDPADIGQPFNSHLEQLLTDFADDLEATRNLANFDFTIDQLVVVEEWWNYFYVESDISVRVDDPPYASWGLNPAALLTKTTRTKVETTGTFDPAYLQISLDYGGSEDRVILFTDEKLWESGDFASDGAWKSISEFMDLYRGREYYPSPLGGCLSDRYEGEWLADMSDPQKRFCSMESIVLVDDHPGLDPLLGAGPNIAHLDYQVLTEDPLLPIHPCDDGGPTLSEEQVGMTVNIDDRLILTRKDAERYNLDQDAVWANDMAGVEHSPFCPPWPP